MTDLSLDAARTALVLLDLQRDIVADSELAPTDPDARARFDGVVDRCASLLVAVRATKARVIHVRVAFSPGHPEASPHAPLFRYMRDHDALVDGAPGTDFDPRVAPTPTETVLTKHGVSAFVGTGLDRLLRDDHIDTLALAGLVTHWVVEGTARHAADLGYRVLVLTDTCTSADLARHEASLQNLRPLTTLTDTETFLPHL